MHVVICGGGKIGSYLAGVLLDSGNEVSVIEENRKTADMLSIKLDGRYLIINGDGCDSRFQEDAGVRSADIFVGATGQDDTNLVACEVASRVFNVSRVIARVNNPRNLPIFREVGIECVSSTTLIAGMIEEEALMGSVSIVSSLTHGNVALSEFTIGRMKHHSNEEGITIGEIEMPPDSLIVAVAYEDDAQVASEDIVLYPGDQVIVVADRDSLDDVRATFRSL
jgi:trk system potassium uptake protein TrkA